jgi:gliding motility-associated-like protein
MSKKLILISIFLSPLITFSQLTLSSSSPATASNTVSLDSDITIVFNLPVRTSTLNASNIVITGKNTGIISGTFSGGGTTSVVFNPTTDFKPGEVITVTLTSALENTSGGPLSPPQTFSFTTRNAATPSPTFTAADIATSADGVRSVFAADMDGDGDMDILSASQIDDTIAWYENDGNANPTFTAVDVATSADGAFSVFAADMDGDGDMDIVSASFYDDTIAWYENDGNANPTWTAADVATSADGARSVFAADMDGDGDMDILSASQIDKTIAWYENDGNANPTWTAADVATSADGAFSVFAADMDGDGDMDIVSASYDDDTIAWYENDGNANPTWTAADIATSADGAYSVFAADMDGDGDMDILSASQLDNTIAWHEINSAPTNILLSSTSVNENVTIGTTVGSLSTTDSDSGDTHAYTLVAGSGDTDNASFSISGANLLTGTAIDYETKNSYSIRVQTSDGTATYSKTFIISVADVFEDEDGDGISDQTDNCQSSANPNQADADADGIGDVCDNCINTSNINQLDTDGDEIGNDCDDDDDNDGVPDSLDAFPISASESIDTDGDGIGDNADPDADNDGILDISDNCIVTINIDQADLDGDGIGDVCDPDADGDGYTSFNEASCGTSDFDAIAIPLDTDGDYLADCVDDDDDNDGYYDIDDAFPLDGTEWFDTDSDGTGNNADNDDDNDGWLDTVEINCETDPLDILSVPIDTDGDGEPNCIDIDDDNDTYLDTQDAFPLDVTEWIDTDSDGTGDNGDTDDDNDQYLDIDEISCESDPLDAASLPLDYDKDLSPDCVDENDDNDYCLDIEDDFPLNKELCKDCDNDQIDNQYEWDSDNDGYPDHRDDFICDPLEWIDNDLDGIGDNEDQDDNNDGFPDENLIVSTALTPKTSGIESTWKIINIDKYPFTSVKVYSQDGVLVYKSEDYKNDWRGENIRKGSALPTGPYYYRIAAGGDSKEVLDGWLYIFN